MYVCKSEVQVYFQERNPYSRDLITTDLCQHVCVISCLSSMSHQRVAPLFPDKTSNTQFVSYPVRVLHIVGGDGPGHVVVSQRQQLGG